MNDPSFLSRWSRLKRKTERDEEGAPVASPPVASPPVASPPAAAQSSPADPSAPPAIRPEQAPPPPPPPPGMDDALALTADADFRPFLRPDVAEDVRREALRRLWASDPIITAHDGLTDYADDFTLDSSAGQVVRTAWRIGRIAMGDEPSDRYDHASITRDASDEAEGTGDVGDDDEKS